MDPELKESLHMAISLRRQPVAKTYHFSNNEANPVVGPWKMYLKYGIRFGAVFSLQERNPKSGE